MFTSGSKTVDQVGQLNIEGNVIPTTWFSKITYENGKPDLNAIVILSEIVYWYRPKVVRDEESGRTLGVAKKFKADKLQRSYDSFANQFGLSNRQVKYAIDRLCKIGVINREFRTINTEKTPLYNVIFLDINVQKLAEISLYTPLHLNVPPTFECTTPLHSDVPPPTFKCNTYTEITTEINNNINNKEPCLKNEQVEQDLFSEILNIWKPDLNSLNAWLMRAGLKPMTQEQVNLVLVDVNAHYQHQYESGRINNNQMYSKFVHWIKRDSTDYKKNALQPKQSHVSLPASHKNVNSLHADNPDMLVPVTQKTDLSELGLSDDD